jgi:hypothetical protein
VSGCREPPLRGGCGPARPGPQLATWPAARPAGSEGSSAQPPSTRKIARGAVMAQNDSGVHVQVDRAYHACIPPCILGAPTTATDAPFDSALLTNRERTVIGVVPCPLVYEVATTGSVDHAARPDRFTGFSRRRANRRPAARQPDSPSPRYFGDPPSAWADGHAVHQAPVGPWARLISRSRGTATRVWRRSRRTRVPVCGLGTASATMDGTQ